MEKVLSGMRPTGRLHIGHYYGALKNWLELQEKHDCFYFVADWHALTTNYEDPEDIIENRRQLILDWLSVGIDPNKCTMFVQSHNIYHAELSLLLSMLTPVSWLERCPTYKEIKQEQTNKDLSNLGFLSYPVLMTADIIMYNATYVPVGEDQLPHIEISREIIRRFHHLYSCEVFTEPKGVLTEVPRLPGLDGRKMSKSYGNAIMLSEDLKEVESKVKKMVTDTNRQRLKDPGNPEVCPVFDYHKVFSTEEEREYITKGCTSAGIGCMECKMILFKHMQALLEPIQERRRKFEAEITDINEFIKPMQDKANAEAACMMEKVRKALKI
ncbi:tryptophan--tRNA ligase [Seleniivibrio woodruffii]|uniref:Tryptophan--tRNA ligase n=1 Tax=Seleniivibrio woodruffii TaxID=1078050 RepID=A0A4R1K8Y3_9BACT|nr:tryptophan--tRNA ligase [Seleniivibrio woodruffii]TCK60794.1 tryptophanyl-tRNA synthetase [Seleniivibrio woodruffii]TVZ36424.1 tryptophanyl-tRNA synthetase [Seleniivibrio woodruffii]